MVGDVVSVKAYVISKGETETVISRSSRKEVKKCELIISDGTFVIGATIWEDVVDSVAEGQFYLFGNVKVGHYSNRYLQCTPSSTIKPCDEEIKISEEMKLQAEYLKPKVRESEEIVGRILAADITKLYVCVNCNARISVNDDGEAEMVKCTSCGLVMLAAALTSTVSANVLIGE